MTARKPAAAPAAAADPGVFDLDAARAARREAVGASFPFTFGGTAFTLPPAKEWPVEATDMLAVGQIGPALKLLMGDQWSVFSSLGATVGDLTDLFKALSAWQGLTPGE